MRVYYSKLSHDDVLMQEYELKILGDGNILIIPFLIEEFFC